MREIYHDAAKRRRLELIVSPLKPAVAAERLDYGFWLEAKRCATGWRRIRSEICRSPGESGAEKLFGFGEEEEALCAEPILLWANA